MSPSREVPILNDAGRLTVIDDIVLVEDRDRRLIKFTLADMLPLAQAAMDVAGIYPPNQGTNREHAPAAETRGEDMEFVIRVLRRYASPPP